jgi:3-hydroxymyristoyl/3-hydroxydecanoyl-(acyl carrier protein) dehydratase
MDEREITRLIPHRPPFLWIDRIVELEPGVRCVAVKFVDPAQSFFAGHFPRRAILPGVFLIEAVAQTAGVMLSSSRETGLKDRTVDSTPLLAAVNRFKFLKPVLPGSELRIETRRLTDAGPMVYIEGTVQVGGEMVAKGELSVVCS